MLPNPEDAPFAPASAAGGGAFAGMTRVTFSRGNHRFEFKCDPGSEALLARAVLDLARLEQSPLEPGDAFALCRQIESMAAGGSSGPRSDESGPRKQAA